MPSRRQIILGSLALFVAGCVSLPPIRFSPSEIRGWRYVGTNVTASADANISWSGIDSAFAATKGIVQPAAIAGPGAAEASAPADFAERVRQLTTTEPTRSEYRKFILSQASGPISAAMGQALAGEMTGGRDVRVEVVIKSIIIHHTALRLLAEMNQMLSTEVTLTDAKTGEKLVVYPALVSIVQLRGGVPGLLIDAAIAKPAIDQLSTVQATSIRNWLFTR